MNTFTLPVRITPQCIIRLATKQDLPRLLEIYQPYVERTAISFEIEVPSLEEFTRRYTAIVEQYPYIVAEVNGVIIGYAYASAFHARKAYEHCAELSIYLDEAARGKGIGHLLYESIECILQQQYVYNVYACIAFTEDDTDPYLTNDSEHFHTKQGYQQNALFKKCGYKFNRWYDMIWMEKFIGKHPKVAPSFIKFSILKQSFEKN